MAGDWIKMRGNLWDDPRIAKLCDTTDQSEAAVVGGLYWLWATADQHSEDGVMPGLTLRQIDRKTGVGGLGDALVSIGWIADHPEGVRVVRFEEHNGSSAKKRCQTAKRVAAFKGCNAQVTPDDEKSNAQSVTESLVVRDLEKRREEKKTNTSPAKLPTCPTQTLVDLYHEVLPELPSVKLMPAKREKAVKTFWHFVLTSKKTDGTTRATNTEEAIAWVRQFFERARGNDFLMGKTNRGEAHAGWQCDLDFLLSEKGRIQVIEKTKEHA